MTAQNYPSPRAGRLSRTLVLLLAPGLAVAGCSSSEVQTALVPRGEAAPLDRIVALGRIEPRGGLISIAGPPGTRIGSMAVREGDRVQPGDELFRLDNLNELEANRRSIAAQIAEAEGLIAAQEREEAVLREEYAIEERQVTELDPLDIKAQEAQVTVLEKSLAHTQDDLRTLEALQKDGSTSVARQQVEAQRLLVQKTRGERDAAQHLLAKMKKAHELAQDKVRHDLQGRRIGLATEKVRLGAHLQSLKENLRLAEIHQDQATIRAPVAGQVLKILTRAGESIGNQPVLQMGGTDQMDVVAEVSEAAISELRHRPVQQVKITGPGDLQLSGTVDPDGIGRMIGRNSIYSLNPAMDADSRVVEVKIHLDEPSSATARGLTNMQVYVTLDLESRPAASGRGPGS